MKYFLLVASILNCLTSGAQSPGFVHGKFLWLRTSQDTLEMVNSHYFNSSILLEDHPHQPINHQYHQNLKSLLGLSVTNGQFNTMTAFIVHSKANQECPVWSINKEDSGLCVMSTKRLARLTDYKYFNHSGQLDAPLTISTYFQKTEGFDIANYQIQLGNYSAYPDLPLTTGNQFIPELILYNRVLTPREIDKIETYLALRYGLTIQKNYIGCSDQILWNYRHDSLYHHNIFGIGYDHLENLNLRTSSPIKEVGFITLTLDSAANIPTGAFVIAGDNGKEKSWAEKIQGQPQLMSRIWKIKRSGNISAPLSLSVTCNSIIGEPIIDSSYWLLVDKTGSGNFSIQDVVYYRGTLANHKVLFNLPVDSDSSGADVIAIAAAGEIIQKISFQAPTCDSQDSGEIRLGVEGGTPPYKFSVEGVGHHFLKRWTTTGNELTTLANLHSGEYIVSIRDHDGNSIVESIYLEASDAPKSQLEGSYEISATRKLLLDATVEDYSCTYTWEKNGQVIGDSPILEVNNPGEYTIKIRKEDCESRKRVTVTAPSLQLMEIGAMPNPSISGYTNLRIATSSVEPIEVYCFDIAGRHLSSKTLSGKTFYSYSQFFETAGLYIIKAYQNGSEAAIKLEIQ